MVGVVLFREYRFQEQQEQIDRVNQNVQQAKQESQEVRKASQLLERDRQKLWDQLTETVSKGADQWNGILNKEDVIALCVPLEGEDIKVCSPNNFKEDISTTEYFSASKVTYRAPLPFSCAIFAEKDGVNMEILLQTTNGCVSVVVFRPVACLSKTSTQCTKSNN